jgi:hypothetical protein
MEGSWLTLLGFVPLIANLTVSMQDGALTGLWLGPTCSEFVILLFQWNAAC